MTHFDALIGSSPAGSGGLRQKATLAALRALRTFLQGMAAALVTAFVGRPAFDATWTQTFQFLMLSALVTAVASFLNNIAGILPEDPTQKAAAQPATLSI